MCQQSAQNHAVGGEQKAGVKSIPADKGGIAAHQRKQWQIGEYTMHRRAEIMPGKIKVNEASYGQCDEIQDQGVVVVIQVNEFDVQQNEYDVERGYEPD